MLPDVFRDTEHIPRNRAARWYGLGHSSFEPYEFSRSALRLLLEAGGASGCLRGDVDPTDVMRVINGIRYLPDGPEWRADVGRMLDLVIDGLRYGCSSRTGA